MNNKDQWEVNVGKISIEEINIEETNKLKVYNGYEERYMTGREIKKYFAGCYVCFGQNHENVSSHQIDIAKYYGKIKDSVSYRHF